VIRKLLSQKLSSLELPDIASRIFSPAQPVYPVASVRDFLSGAYTVGVTGFVMGGGMRTRLGIRDADVCCKNQCP
jgi:hypothetical protein